jgi:tRNA(Ile)-lysidine synthetase-like protein
MPDPALSAAIASVPAGSWVVGVSGGPDSVALLGLMRTRADLSLHVVHLDHQLRASASNEDARFVEELSRRWNIPCTVTRRDEIEPGLKDLPANPSARYRRLRLALFARVVARHALHGVILAHHADDQAETVLQRLLRGSGPAGLAGMSPRARVEGLEIQRPLLGVRRDTLRAYLDEIGQPWRTDESNASPRYQRNRLRALLGRHGKLVGPLLELGKACAALREWTRSTAPALDHRFAVAELADLPDLLARESARRWLARQGAAADELAPDVLDRLVTMARDAASPARQHFPGRLLVRRRGGSIFVDGTTQAGRD